MPDIIRVLYVDDEPTLLEVARVFLEKTKEFRVDTSLSAIDALDSPAIHQCDAIVADYKMPEMDGIEFLKIVRERFGEIPFILFTGRGREEVVMEAINHGADFYLQKGGDPRAQFAELGHKIRQAVRGRQAERSLHDSERRLADIIDFLPDATFAIDNAGKVIAWNRAIEEMTGIPARDMLGRGNFEYAIPIYGSRRPILIDLVNETDEVIAPLYNNISRDGNSLTAESDIASPKGRRISILAKVCPLYNQKGEVTGAIESIRDITRWKQTEDQLVLLKTSVDQAHDEVFWLDFEGNILYVNDAACQTTGYPREELLSMKIYTLDPDFPPEVWDTSVADLRNRKNQFFRTRHRKKDGTIIDVEIMATYVRKSDREYSFAFVRDITGQKRIEDSVKESEARYRELADLLPQIVFEVDPGFNVTYANRHALETLGLSADDIAKGINAISFIEPADRPKVFENIQKYSDGRFVEPHEYRAMRKDGGRIPVMIYSAPIYRGATLTGFRGIIVDISARKAIEEGLLESEKKFRTLVELSLDGIIICDFSGTLLFANQAAGQIVEEPEYMSLIGRENILTLIAPESRPDVICDLAKVMGGTENYLATYKVITRSMNEVWVECIGKKIPYGGSDAVLVSMRDITDRRKAELSARESEDRFATVFKKSPVSLTLISAKEGKFIDVSDSFLEETGYSRDEVIGRMSEDLGIFADAGEYQRFTSLIRETGMVNGLEFKCRVKSGETRICRFTSAMLLMHGEPFILSTVENVTERREAKAAQQAMVKSMLGSTGLSSLKNIAETLCSWLSADCVMIGEIQACGDAVHVLYMLLDGKEIPDFSYTLRATPCENVAQKGFCLYPDNVAVLFPESPDLAELNIRGYAGTPLRDSSGSVIGVLCILSRKPLQPPRNMQDTLEIIATKVSAEVEWIQAERRIRQSEEKFRSIVETSPNIIWETDLQGHIRYISPIVQEVLGYSPDALTGQPITTLIPREYHSMASKWLQEITRRVSTPLPIEVPTLHDDGHGVMLEIRPTLLVAGDGTLLGLRGVAVDITERKKTEDALRRANRQLSLLSSITRHDIMNNISIILGFLHLEKETVPDPARMQFLDKIEASARTIKSQIEFAKAYQEIGTQQPRWFDLDAILPRRYLPPTITLDSRLNGISVYADPMLEKVFFNLLDNSIRHGETVTRVHVTSGMSDDCLVISWEDNGIGVPQDQKERIFEKGYGKNTGLGMFLSREILQLTGIRIRETGTPGTGARFEIMVPRGHFRGVPE